MRTILHSSYVLIAFATSSSLAKAADTTASSSSSSPPKPHELTPDYSFEQYIVDFNKPYAHHDQNGEIYQSKKQIFESNLKLILDHNSHVQYDIQTGQRKTIGDGDGGEKNHNGHTYHMGVNQFMDLSEDERHDSFYFGYDKRSILHKGLLLDDTTNSMLLLKSIQESDDDDHKMGLPFNITDISTLPSSVNYTKYATPVKNQGSCGSCWAFSSITALETHLAIQTDELNVLSTQELVSCVNNPSECGGTGGCEGATAELAYNYVANYGIVKEQTFPYEASDDPVCPMSLSSSSNSNSSSRFEKDMNMIMTTTTKKLLRSRRISSLKSNVNSSPEVVGKIKGYANIPSNDYKALMNTIAKHGPAVVALAASSWSFYAGGVYSPSLPTQATDWDMNHGVVVEGFGTDEITGQDYWLVRNSWGDSWGENGYIRLKRVDPELEPSECGFDETPLDGIGCALNKDGSKIIQKKVKVCGTNGLLFDPVVPIAGYKVL